MKTQTLPPTNGRTRKSLVYVRALSAWIPLRSSEQATKAGLRPFTLALHLDLDAPQIAACVRDLVNRPHLSWCAVPSAARRTNGDVLRITLWRSGIKTGLDFKLASARAPQRH